MNRISETQNEPEQLGHLAGQRYLYSLAKRFLAIQMIAALTGVLLGLIAATFYPIFRLWASYYGVVVTAIDYFYVTRKVDEYRTLAAKTQEQFDCSALEMEWPKLKAGKRPENEVHTRNLKRYRKSDPSLSKILNWYPLSVAQLPMYLARIICQRANLRWDADLRRRYASALSLFLGFSTITLATAAIYNGLTLDKFLLAAVVPMTPAFYLVARQVRDNREAAERLQRLREFAEEIWERSVDRRESADQVSMESRRLQDEIFAHRSKTPLIFDRIYEIFRDEQEEEMNVNADLMADEAKRKLGPWPDGQA